MNPPIVERLSALLTETGLEHKVHHSGGTMEKAFTDTWEICFVEDGVKNTITPETRISELFWLDHDYTVPAKGFGKWMSDLNEIFHRYYGCTSSNFEDHNWFDEYENDVSPGDAFAEWKSMNDAGILGG